MDFMQMVAYRVLSTLPTLTVVLRLLSVPYEQRLFPPRIRKDFVYSYPEIVSVLTLNAFLSILAHEDLAIAAIATAILALRYVGLAYSIGLGEEALVHAEVYFPEVVSLYRKNLIIATGFFALCQLVIDTVVGAILPAYAYKYFPITTAFDCAPFFLGIIYCVGIGVTIGLLAIWGSNFYAPAAELKRKAVFCFKNVDGAGNVFLSKYIWMEEENVECPACLQKKTGKRVPKFGACEHRMCFVCLKSYIDTCANSSMNGTKLECPLDHDHEVYLTMELVDKVLEQDDPYIDLPKLKLKLEKAFLRSGLHDLEHIRWCPSRDCTYAVCCDKPLIEETFANNLEEYERKKEALNSAKREKEPVNQKRKAKKNVFGGSRIEETSISLAEFVPYKCAPDGQDMRLFECDKCRWTYCAVCEQPWIFNGKEHTQLTCEDHLKQIYRDSAIAKDMAGEDWLTAQMIESGIKAGLMKKCPSCNALFEKDRGCKRMKCSECNADWCWDCLRSEKCRCRN